MKVKYVKHPVSKELKAKLRAEGYTIIDAVFAPQGEAISADDRSEPDIAEPTADELDEMDVEALHALAKKRSTKVAHNAGADKVREALRAQ